MIVMLDLLNLVASYCPLMYNLQFCQQLANSIVWNFAHHSAAKTPLSVL